MSAKDKYPHLFSPLKVGKITLKHRIIYSPHWNALWDPETGGVNDRVLSFYKERCEGGAPWIIICNSSPSGAQDYYPATNVGWWYEPNLPGLKKLVDMVHSYGIPCSAQFSMPGNHQIPLPRITAGDFTRPEASISSCAKAPAEFSPWQTAVAHEMEDEEIERILDDFRDAAKRAVSIGCDGVEALVGHGKLPNQFFSPLLNRRTDKWGGDIEGRARFIIEIAKHLREGAGPDKTVGIRINGTDFFPGSATIEDWAELARMLEASGAVDYISTTQGLYRTVHVMITSHYSGFEPGYEAVFTAKIKQAVKKLPVFLVGHINSAELAERMIAQGVCDAVLVARGFVADPHFAKKIIEGREEDIRPCIRCNQGCLMRVFYRGIGGIACMVNPVAGDEYRWGSWTETKTTSPKKVLIIGGGAAGLECARELAERGHKPVIYEKGKEIGGQMRWWAKCPGSTEVWDWVEWMKRQLSKLGVPINLGIEVTDKNVDDIIKKENPDVIVVATGSFVDRKGMNMDTYQEVKGWDRPNVFTYDDLFNPEGFDFNKLGKKVIVYDIQNDRRTWRTIEACVRAGKDVLYVTPRKEPATEFMFLVGENTPAKFNVFTAAGKDPNRWSSKKILVETLLIEVTEKAAKLAYLYDPEQRTWEEPCDSIVLVSARLQNDSLYKLLKSKGYKPYLIGDAYSPRWLMHAVRDGYRLARTI